MLYANGKPVGGGGGTGGHTIIDENDNSMTARACLQFVGGVNVSDDPTNDKTIVDISGGSGVYIEKTLWEDVNGLQFSPNNIQTITLSESLNKYDFIYVDVSSVAESGYHNQNILTVSSLYDENDGYNGVVCIGGNINLANAFAKVDNTHLKFIGFSSANPLIVWKVVGIKVSGDYYSPVIYSLEEREIGVWTDGKPLYEKTNIITNVTDKGWTQIFSDSNANVLSYTGYCLSNTNEKSPLDRYVDNNNQVRTLIYDSGTKVQTEYYNQFNTLASIVATIQYTKTTDTAGSGSWTPQGVPTHHYSTDEQVIGTWIDGSTLYERTFDFSSNPIDLSANSWTNTTASNSGIDKVINNEAMTSDGININWLGVNAGTGSYIQLLNIRNSTIGIAYLTIQYTKSS